MDVESRVSDDGVRAVVHRRWRGLCGGRRMLYTAAVVLFGVVALTGVFTLTGHSEAHSKGDDVGSCACSSLEPDVTLHLTATIRDYVIENAEAGVSTAYRTRTWCDGSKNTSTMCDGLGIFGPSLTVRPGQRLRVIVRNEFDMREARALGPRPPTPADWFPLADEDAGRYAFMKTCGFVFTGKPPARPEDMVRDVTNMPGHEGAEYEVTNIHLHGLEIQPHLFEPLGTLEPTARMVRTSPGQCKCYDFDIPDDHPAGGSYWYHPHMHSSIAIQAWSGMAGLIYVPGALDDLLQERGVVQDLPFTIWDPHFRELGEEVLGGIMAATGASANASVRGLLGPRSTIGVDYFLRDQTDQSSVWYLVNAQYQPTFQVRPGEPIRLRVLCATAENLAGFEVLDAENRTVPFWVMGSDGVAFSNPVARSRLVMSGGQREEVLLSLPAVGRYTIVSRGLTKVQFYCTGPADAVLAVVEVAGEAWPPPMFQPTALLLPATKKAIDQTEISRSRTVTFSLAADRSRVPFPQFQQNGKPFNETAIEFRVKAGTAEEWILMNPDRTMHPFHLHVVPFQVREMQSSYMPNDPAMKDILTFTDGQWRDSVTVPAQGFVRIWVRFGAEHRGKTVAHCHFLAHEDTGMIMNILIE